jgi:asparagine synthase (glutamine-hydrolysing)
LSGFAGVVSTDGAPPDESLLKRMAERLAFRGPDGTHIWKQPGAGFCFTFLRTGPALQCPSQPCSLDGNVWLLGDVRLDGRGDLRLKLEQHGEELAGNITDEELVLRVWRRWGEQGLPELLGDYAFALWDAEARRLWCVRDLMGARPFFYAHVGGRLYFGNTLNALRCASEISSDLDLHFIGDFLLEGWCLYPTRTAFRDITRLAAGHVVKYSCEELNVRRFAALPIEEPLRLKREEEYVERFRELLEQAVADRLPRGPTAIFMSGGLDSTSVAAIAVNMAWRHSWPLALRAFTIDCSGLFDDREGVLASLAARHIGIAVEIMDGSSCVPFAGWADPCQHPPEPCHEPFRAAYLEQVASVSRHARVALNGYGGDGILTGQTWPYLLYLLRDRQIVTIAREFGGYIVKNGQVPPLRSGFLNLLRRWINRANSRAYPEWLAPEFEKEVCLRERWVELRQPPVKRHPYHSEAYAILAGPYWASMYESEDAAFSFRPVELRAPLLDSRILKFLLRTPPVPLCINKDLLRRAVRELLPEQILGRRKTPLAGDPLLLHLKDHGWSPLPPSGLGKVRKFVDSKKLSSLLREPSQLRPWIDLCSISLLYWLEGSPSSERL